MMAFIWCPVCKKNLVPKGVSACRHCSDTAWIPPADKYREDLRKGDRMLLISVVVAACIAAVIIAAYSL